MSITKRQPELRFGRCWRRQGVIAVTFGIWDAHRRMTSGAQAARSGWDCVSAGTAPAISASRANEADFFEPDPPDPA
jgi:hypothetical protein